MIPIRPDNAAYTLTNRVNQIRQRTSIWLGRPDALELRGPVVAVDICPIEKPDIKMYIEIKSGAEPLYQPGRAGVTAPVAPSLSCSLALWIRWLEIAQ